MGSQYKQVSVGSIRTLDCTSWEDVYNTKDEKTTIRN